MVKKDSNKKRMGVVTRGVEEVSLELIYLRGEVVKAAPTLGAMGQEFEALRVSMDENSATTSRNFSQIGEKFQEVDDELSNLSRTPPLSSYPYPYQSWLCTDPGGTGSRSGSGARVRPKAGARTAAAT